MEINLYNFAYYLVLFVRNFLRISTLFVYIFFAFLGFDSTAFANECADGDYVVSAYYSPLPGQNRYATVTYVGDIKLNGGGVTTASGVKVAEAPGAFIAAPSCFSFGTILEFAGMGNYIVLDRGGAIKNNRLDLWLGYGDEGLDAALKWGKRTVNVRNLGKDADVDLAVKAEWRLPVNKSYLKTVTTNPFDLLDNLKLGDTGASVAVLQQLLFDLGYYKGEVDGYFGAATKKALLEMELEYGEVIQFGINPLGILGTSSIDDIQVLVVNARKRYLENLPENNMGKGAVGQDVLKLQQALRLLGYTVDFTSVFDDLTEQALIQYQLDNGLINASTDLAAGYFGQMTRNELIESIKQAFPESLDISQDSNSELNYRYLTEVEKFKNNLKLGITSQEVRRLQDVLKRMNFLRVEPTGYYGPVTQNAVLKMQLKYGLIANSNSAGAGEVGPATRRLLNNFQNSYLARLQMQIKSVDLDMGLFRSDLSIGNSNNDVFQLQKFLQEQGYFDGVLLTKYFGEVTQQALINFQRDNNIQTDRIGSLDSMTRDFINSRFK